MTWAHPTDTKKERSLLLSCACCPIFHNLILFPHPSSFAQTTSWALAEIGTAQKSVRWQSGFFIGCAFACRLCLQGVNAYRLYIFFLLVVVDVQCCVMICDLPQKRRHRRQPVWSVVFKLCIKYEFMKLQWRSTRVWNDCSIDSSWLPPSDAHQVANDA